MVPSRSEARGLGAGRTVARHLERKRLSDGRTSVGRWGMEWPSEGQGGTAASRLGVQRLAASYIYRGSHPFRGHQNQHHQDCSSLAGSLASGDLETHYQCLSQL